MLACTKHFFFNFYCSTSQQVCLPQRVSLRANVDLSLFSMQVDFKVRISKMEEYVGWYMFLNAAVCIPRFGPSSL